MKSLPSLTRLGDRDRCRRGVKTDDEGITWITFAACANFSTRKGFVLV
jgi:hypothetical protein